MRNATKIAVLGKKLWTPANISTILWLDAADNSTLIFNGASISQWRDKGLNSRHFFQNDANSQPQYSANGLSSLPTLSFNGSSSYLTTLNPMTIGNSSAVSYNVAIVFNQSSVSTAARFVFRGSSGSGSQNTDYGLFSEQTTGDSSPLYRFGTGSAADGGAWQRITSVSVTTNPIIFTGVMAATTSNTGSKQSYFNGILSATGNYTIKGASATEVAIGSQINSGVPANFLHGNISEVIMTNQSLNDIERQRIEGYLAHKWRLASNLPDNHLFRFIPPFA